MPQGLHPSFFHSFKVKINLTKMELHVVHANRKFHWTPLHHAWHSFKVHVKCGKDGSVNFKQEDPETCFFLQMIHIIQMKQLITKEMIRNQFFFQIQLLANGLVHCKEDGLEQNFSYEVRNYA